jgi:hypothetical protein
MKIADCNQNLLIYQLFTMFYLISDSTGNGIMLIAYDIGDRILMVFDTGDVILTNSDAARTFMAWKRYIVYLLMVGIKSYI